MPRCTSAHRAFALLAAATIAVASVLAVAIGPAQAQDQGTKTTATAIAECPPNTTSATILVTLAHLGAGNVTATIGFEPQSEIHAEADRPVGYVVDLAAGQTITVPRFVADDFYVVEVSIDGARLESIDVAAFCDRGSSLAASVRSFCDEPQAGGPNNSRRGAFEFRLYNPAEPVDFTVSVTGLANRTLTVDDVTTTYRTGRSDGLYRLIVVADGQTLLNQIIELDCFQIATAATSSTSCLAVSSAKGVIATTLSNGGTEPLPYIVEYSGRTSPVAHAGTLDVAETKTVRRSGRPDGVYTVTVLFATDGTDGGGLVAEQPVIVDCEPDQPAPTPTPTPQPTPELPSGPTASVEVLCVNNDGLIRFRFAAGQIETVFTAYVQGLDDRSVTVAPGETGRIGRSGRRDGSYAVSVHADGTPIIATMIVTVACDGPAPTPQPPVEAPDLIDVIDARPDLTQFAQLIREVGMGDQLRSLDQAGFTVFAPNDEAFAAFGEEAIEDLRTNHPDELTHLIRSHVATGFFSSAALSVGGTLTTLGDELILHSGPDGVLTAGGAPVVAPDLAAVNGTIHVLGQIAAPEGERRS